MLKNVIRSSIVNKSIFDLNFFGLILKVNTVRVCVFSVYLHALEPLLW